MAKPKPVVPPTAQDLAPGPRSVDQQNRRLLDWLGDDAARARLFGLITRNHAGHYVFGSRDVRARGTDDLGYETPRADARTDHRPVTLITDRIAIQNALRGGTPPAPPGGVRYTNRVYTELGGGSFMLALEPAPGSAHATQTAAFAACFPRQSAVLGELGFLAVQAATVTGLRASDLDLAAFAEQAGVRFCLKLFGYALRDFPLLEGAVRSGYQALVYQVFGRHFTTDPVAIPTAKIAAGRLMTRTAALIDAYHRHDPADPDPPDELRGAHDRALPPGMTPVLKALARHASDLNGEQRAVIAVGTAIGTVGNVQAAACIAIAGLFRSAVSGRTPNLNAAVTGMTGTFWQQAHALARAEDITRPTQRGPEWRRLIGVFLAENPPIPYLPRLVVDANGEGVAEVLLALGGATDSTADPLDPLVWGLPPPNGGGQHWCRGNELAWPLIVEIVRQTMRLPNLAEQLDPEDASVIGLKKRWGFLCERYPLTHTRERRAGQSSLNVAMRLKPPLRESADRAREIIRAGAPRIEEALRESRHIHFAWFELIEGDTVLVLHTVYDGPFAAYIQDFALKVGDLFDLLFDCIEDAPPRPIDKFPNEFIAMIQRYNRPPAMGYFFSAYPNSTAARIIRDERMPR